MTKPFAALLRPALPEIKHELGIVRRRGAGVLGTNKVRARSRQISQKRLQSGPACTLMASM